MIHCLSHFANHFRHALGLLGKYMPKIMQLQFMQFTNDMELVLGNSAEDNGCVLTLQLPLYLHLAQES